MHNPGNERIKRQYFTYDEGTLYFTMTAALVASRV
jgi:hypothetical protein